ncbi:MAG: TRAP transporter small permease [bacterium]
MARIRAVARIEHRAAAGSRWIAVTGLIVLVAVALVTIGDVLLRWLFNSPVDGVTEVSRLMVAIAIASFFPVALADRHHVAITFLGGALGPRARAWLEALSALVTSLFFLIVGWQFILYTLDLNASGETTWMLGWKVAPWWAVTTFFMLLCIPVQIIVLTNQCRVAFRGDVEVPPPEMKPEPVPYDNGEY